MKEKERENKQIRQREISKEREMEIIVEGVKKRKKEGRWRKQEEMRLGEQIKIDAKAGIREL